MPHFVVSDLGLHCLLRPLSMNTLGKYDILFNLESCCFIFPNQNSSSENSHSAPPVYIVESPQHPEPIIITETGLKKAKLQQDKTELKNLMAEGSEASLKNVNKAAVISYKKALDITLHAADVNVSISYIQIR